VSIREDAATLESLLPAAMSVLFPPKEEDPLKNHSLGQVRLMRCLLAGSRTAGELGQIAGLSPSSLTQMASRLIAAGLVSKKSDAQDKRVRKLSLTDAGRDLMETRRAARVDSAADMLRAVPAERRRELIELLADIARCAPPVALVEVAV
jgi:DNA-binding MarR family transcriptional regulator